MKLSGRGSAIKKSGMDIPEIVDFADISPIDDKDFRHRMAELVTSQGLEHAVKYVMPDVDYPQFVEFLKGIPNKKAFQQEVMWPFMELLAKKTTSGVSISGIENLESSQPVLFMSNHRDIVLDASFLNICLMRHRIDTCEIAIGNNLLIMPWIDTLVRINKCFLVKRNLKRLEALNAAKQLSAYIHHAINNKREKVWIAQREGRAKDSSDRTQESLIKMLALAGGGNTAQNIAQLNITPVSIAYEYDPNDYLKVREFLLKRRNPEFKKSQRDDLFSMETGLMQFKGHVHFSIGDCITPEVEALGDADRNTVLSHTCDLIDNSIHTRYKIYSINYIAYDELTESGKYEMLYTRDERERFIAYVEHQLEKVDVKDISPDERYFMRMMMFTMYANPLKNKLEALDRCKQHAPGFA